MMIVSASITKLQSLFRPLFKTIHFLIVFLVENPFFLQVVYFSSSSTLGYFALKVLKHRNEDSFTPRNLDFLFTSVSAATVSSMSTIEMEVFSNEQLIVFAILMFIGGEVFTSMIGLHFSTLRLKNSSKSNDILNHFDSSSPSNLLDQVEFGNSIPKDELLKKSELKDVEPLKYNALKFLGFVVLGYLLVIQFLGAACLAIYISVNSSAREVLRNKGLKLSTFSFFTIFSFFSSCGFVPTNENMIVFRKNSGLLLILIPQVLFGNTLFPSSLRFLLRISGNYIKKRESDYLLKNTKAIGYLHLLPSMRSLYLAFTVFGFIVVQFILFSCLEWFSNGLSGMNIYQKIVGIFFQTTNTRHAGGTIVDIATLSSAILALFIVMMYLPPYTTFLPLKEEDHFTQLVLQIDDDNNNSKKKEKKRFSNVMDNLIFSQLTHLAIFILLICITERKSIKQDPLNFSFLNIVLELTSAYGGVGFSTGYNCSKQLTLDNTCQNKSIGFSGRWSDEGKIVMIFVMFYARLKKFNMDGGKAWKLL